ncbi:hypothetical protein [Paenarthrobacter histidinolovorans]|uniref:Uncharacterized protein n=1 Tax=Paenarthrobacter histidinolovorans TaxID=43664 RepID=A0ABW8N2G5_9MICC
MDTDTSRRRTVEVSLSDLIELSKAWEDFQATIKNNPATDPVEYLQKTGSILRSVERLLTSSESQMKLENG